MPATLAEWFALSTPVTDTASAIGTTPPIPPTLFLDAADNQLLSRTKPVPTAARLLKWVQIDPSGKYLLVATVHGRKELRMALPGLGGRNNNFALKGDVYAEVLAIPSLQRVGDAYLLEGTEGEEAHLPLWLPDSSAAVIFDGISMDKFWVVPVPPPGPGQGAKP